MREMQEKHEAGAPVAEPLLRFQAGAYHYEAERVLLEHPDYPTQWVARRWRAHGGPRRRVVLERVDVPEGREGVVRAREALRLSRCLLHPGFLRVWDVVELETGTFLVQEWVEGYFVASLMDVAALLRRPLPPAFATYVAAEVAEALDLMHRGLGEGGHELKAVHRAVSPMHLRLGRDGKVRLGHLLSAYAEWPGRLKTLPGLLRGDLAYTAPEWLRAQALLGMGEGMQEPRPGDTGEQELPPEVRRLARQWRGLAPRQQALVRHLVRALLRRNGVPGRGPPLSPEGAGAGGRVR